MVMVDRLVRADEVIVESTFLIRDDNVFCDQGIFTEAGLVENMAQTAAAGVGSRSYESGKEPPVGFIGGIRNLKIELYPEAGQVITTRIMVEHEVFNASVVRGEVLLDDRVIASCQLKIFLI